MKPKLLCEVHDPSQMEQIYALLEGYGYIAERWKPVDPHHPDYHQLYVWAAPSAKRVPEPAAFGPG